MTLLLRSGRFWIPVVALLTVFFIIPRATSAQTLEVESVSIANGEVNVPSTTDITIKFSDAISTIGLSGAGISGLPIDLDLVNEDCASVPALIVFATGGCAESWSLEDAGRTLVLENVALTPNQVNTLLILFAVSTGGDVLSAPVVIRFSTGPTIPQGSVSGNVSSADVEVEGSIVALTPSSVLEILSSEDTVGIDPLFGFADDAGNYSVTFAPDGDYFVLGLQLDFGILGGLVAPTSKVSIEGVGVGLHDEDDDGIADLVTVAGEGATTGIDVALSSEGSTIKDLQGPIEALVVAEVPTARLSFGAGAGLEEDGTGLTWTYIFTDLISGQAWISAGIGQVAFPPERFDENEDLGPIGLLLSTAQFTGYADSDQAVDWFSAAGGQEFLDDNPGALGAGILMDRLLFNLLLEVLQSGEIPIVPGLEVWSEILKYDHVVDGLTQVFSKQQALEAWIILFVGTGEDPTLHLVAMGDDGTPLLVIGSSPAAENAPAADAAAAAWDGNADLVGIDALELPVTSDGTAVVWAFSYYSATRDSVLAVIVSGGEIGGVLTQFVIPKEDVDSVQPLIPDWIDSPEAIEAADEVAEDFLATHVGVTSTAMLIMGLQPDNPDRGIWRVTYTGGADDGTTEERIVDIDASSGVFVAVEDERTLPGTFSLNQNYPNPFNPETVIPYQVGEAGDVNLTIFNLLGQEIRVLVNGQRTEGSYQVRWDARDGSGALVPSGVYLYRLEAANSIETRRMTLVR